MAIILPTIKDGLSIKNCNNDADIQFITNPPTKTNSRLNIPILSLTAN
jgi:hypothetical protein